MTRSGSAIGDGAQRRVAGADHVHFGVAAALERVLDQARDVGFVFDHEDAWRRRDGHGCGNHIAEEFLLACLAALKGG